MRPEYISGVYFTGDALWRVQKVKYRFFYHAGLFLLELLRTNLRKP
jgi:hypothetical protein